MSYRTLVTLTDGSDSADFIIRDGDFGDMLAIKDQFLEAARRVVKAEVLSYPVAWIDHLVRHRKFAGLEVEAKDWLWGDTRNEWIKVFADRHYELDLLTGKVTSPDWSLQRDKTMSKPRSQIGRAHV